MTRSSTNIAPQPLTQESLALQLGALLAAFTAQYQGMLASTQAHREAIRRADNPGMQAAMETQTKSVNALGALEQRRRELVALACGRFAPLASKRSVAVTLSNLCLCVTDAERPRLQKQAVELK